MKRPTGYEVILGLGGSTAFWDAATFGLIESKAHHLVLGEFGSKFAAATHKAPFLEDSCLLKNASTPNWRNVIQGQLNVTDALERRIDFTTPEGKEYKLRPADEVPTMVVRPRGWHLPEKHMLIDGTPVTGGIVDFGLYFFHNARHPGRRRGGAGNC